MGNKPPEFAPADNPASDSDSFLTRSLTFIYLPFLNFWLLLFPTMLSFDWSMEAVPLLTSLSDLRNVCSITFYSVIAYSVWYIIQNLNAQKKERNIHNGNGFASHLNSGSSSHAVHRNQSGLRRRLHHRRGSSSSSNSDTDDSSCDSHGRGSSHYKPVHILTLSLAILIFPFIPATNVFFYVGFVIAERVLYMPSMGFCVLVAEGAYVLWTRYCRASSKSVGPAAAAGRSKHRTGTKSDSLNLGLGFNNKTIIYLGLILLISAYSVRTVIRNQDWLTEENLYKAGISVNPAKGNFFFLQVSHLGGGVSMLLHPSCSLVIYLSTILCVLLLGPGLVW